ncbi:Brix domain-containing protein [Suillus subaureus]|uniref:Brix domain-containing protein n=1 Tax=Suillus subaureus TaxID=48587 RepID=A0A9P7EEF8_9AGAM|nr:Brix domain-containing protein [Suillus subaureus]KAG1819529.1 Brix domain-containing protein [Suillus subaureus]
MARRRKNRTHLKGAGATAQHANDGAPKSFIIKHGQVGSSVTQLVRDLRKVMEPNTASRLKERNRNKLKDYLTMAPTLGVTHLLALTVTDVAPSLRMVRLPAGPTLSFRVERYSLMKDILKTSRSSRSMGMEYLTAPLVSNILSSSLPSLHPLPKHPLHLPLLMKSFQSLFPPLSPNSMSLSNCRRIVLIAYNPDIGTVDFRHYVITVKPYGISKRVRRVLEGAPKKSSANLSSGFLDLGNEKDVADFLLRKRGSLAQGATASSAAGDDGDAVSLADDYVGRNNKKGQKKAVRLSEVGPRMELRLIKISEGVPGKEGAVLYHEFVKKSKAEAAALKASHVAKERLRKQRREEQERNVQRKKVEKEQGSGRNQEDSDEEASDAEADESGQEAHDEWDEDEDISEVGGSDDEHSDEPGSDEEESEDEPEERPPTKKVRIRGKR